MLSEEMEKDKDHQEKVFEDLSALIDDELPLDEKEALLLKIEDSPVLQEKLFSFQVIKAVLQKKIYAGLSALNLSSQALISPSAAQDEQRQDRSS